MTFREDTKQEGKQKQGPGQLNFILSVILWKKA